MQKMIRATLSLAAQAKLEKIHKEGVKTRPMSAEMRERMIKATNDWNKKREIKKIEMPVPGDVVTLEDLSAVCVEEVYLESDSFLASDPSGEEFEVCFSLIASVN